MPHKTASTAKPAGKYLTFKLADEEYGLTIHKVREIIGFARITRAPHVPDLFRGVVNLRGKVVPVIDLRVRFGLPLLEDTTQSCIIVVEVAHESRTVLIGVLVDSVAEVRAISSANIEPVPSFGMNVDTGFILGMGKSQDRVILLLDIDRVVSSEELMTLESTAAGQD